MAKQPHVWIIEHSSDGKTWVPYRAGAFTYGLKIDSAPWLAVIKPRKNFRIRKYVRSEP